MKNEPSSKTAHLIRQHFLVPENAPFLEIRTTLNSVLPYAEHFHSAFSFGLILAGKTCFSLDGQKLMAEKGDMVLIAPWQAHSCNPIDGVPRSYHMMFIDDAWFREHVGSALEMRDGRRVREPVIKDSALFALASAQVDALASAGHDAANALADLLLKLHEQHGCFAPSAREGSCATLLPGDSRLPWSGEEHETQGLSVSRLANSAGVRRESFSRAVRRRTGLPPISYLHCLRLEKGRRMLRQGRSIAEAAAASGYVDQSHFHRAFVRFFSVTPGCYRKGGSHSYKK